MSEIKILVVEDEPLIAADIEVTLNNIDFNVMAVAYNCKDAMAALASELPDAILLDINLNEEKDGIELAQEINSLYNIPIIFLTSYADRQTLDRAKKVKPAGYIVKPFDEKSLFAALEIALYNFAQSHLAAKSVLSLQQINTNLQHCISEREFDVLKCIYEGKTTQQIAEALYVSVNTVKTHIGSLYNKLNVSSRSQALAALRNAKG